MNSLQVIDIAREALIVLLKVAGPVMLVGLAVGLAIALLQALTQIQEMTLTFVPKILAIFIAVIILLPFMINEMVAFGRRLADVLISIGVPAA